MRGRGTLMGVRRSIQRKSEPNFEGRDDQRRVGWGVFYASVRAGSVVF